MLTDRQLANAVRVLSIDAIQKANSGHPGMPLGMADIATVLWKDYLNHNPNNPHWTNRDRFILSNGHGSMLQYALLHLTGYDLSINDIKQFRQFHSKTPGHPEVGMTPGIETTTGPLGQGLANGVGMAIAEKILGAHFNRDSYRIVDHCTYVFVGDGCLMEGISHEVCSLAGTLKLGKLIVFWDDNGISIDGKVTGWFDEDTRKRFEAYHWQVIPSVNGHDSEELKKAIEEARQDQNRPTLICCKTTIGFASPNKAGTASCHGSPLGEEEVELVKKELCWSFPPFDIPKEYYEAWSAKEKGDQLEVNWEKVFNTYSSKYPELAKKFQRRMNNQLPEEWNRVVEQLLKECDDQHETIATRKASQKVLNGIGTILPELIGGSADLSASNLTKWSGSHTLTSKEAHANYIDYGVREFGMSAIMNGLALYGGFIPYGGTFLIFYSYAANALRMASLMKQRVIFVYTHDSIGLGEDGPTHQPIEQITALRTLPNMSVWRPCDSVETVVAWQAAVERQDGPTSLLLSRQGLSAQKRSREAIEKIKKGGYVLMDCVGLPDAILIATGSEVELAVEAARILLEKEKKIRVVSMPSIDVFMQQDQSYRESVLPASVTARVAIEAGVEVCWHAFVGQTGKVIGINRFGESAPFRAIKEEFGFTADHVVKAVEDILI